MLIKSSENKVDRITELAYSLCELVEDSDEASNIAESALCLLLASQIKKVCGSDVAKQDAKIADYVNMITLTLIHNKVRLQG